MNMRSFTLVSVDAGVDDFLMKPFSSDALADRIQDVMHG